MSYIYDSYLILATALADAKSSSNYKRKLSEFFWKGK